MLADLNYHMGKIALEDLKNVETKGSGSQLPVLGNSQLRFSTRSSLYATFTAIVVIVAYRTTRLSTYHN